MTLKILLTTTSFQDTPGPHHERLNALGATIDRARGPLTEPQLLDLVGDYDGFLCGDDAITRRVVEKSLPRLKVISKYGIGVDKIDVGSCRELGVPVTYCPGVNHTTVAEHVFLLMLASLRKFPEHVQAVRQGLWQRQTGFELRDKHLGVVGLGRIGQEVIKRAAAFDMSISGYGAHFWPADFAQQYRVKQVNEVRELFEHSDIISLNTSLTESSRNLVNSTSIGWMKKHAVIVNCGRGELVNARDVRAALEAGRIGSYATDVLDKEPPPPDHCLLNAPNCIVTPHIASRTFESVARQAMMATDNLIRVLHGQEPLAQV